MPAAPPLSAALGAVLRDLREEFHVSQDELARAGSALGLAWTRSVVAALESGRRQLDAGELLLLPLVVEGAFPNLDPTLADVLAMLPDQVALTSQARIDRTALSDLAAGKAPSKINPNTLDVPYRRTVARAAESARARADDYRRRLGWHASLGKFVQAEREAGEEATTKAARALNVDALTVAVLARKLWGRSLTAERDARVEDAEPDADARRLQALRGHVTRSLLEDLREELKEVRGGAH